MLGEAFDQILVSARAGSDSAWAAIYRDLVPGVLGYLRARGAQDADDLMGEAFLQVVRDLPGFDGDEREFRAWVFVIAHHRLLDDARRRARRPVEAAELSTDELRSGDEDEALESVAAERVRQLIAQLSPDQRDVLLLRIIGDLTVEETARVVGKSEGAVKALQRRGLTVIREALSEAGVTL